DEAGRVISRTKHPNQRHERHETFVWNGFNQLITFNDKAQHQWHYKYDGLGRRIEKYNERDNTTTKYIWDGDQLALTQTFKQDKLIYQRHSVFHGRELLAQQDSYQDKHTTHYAVSQPNGKILGLFTPEGELAWKAEKRTLWGICFDWYQFKYPNLLDPEMLFTGQWLDSESGLAYNRFRYYDPETGNYLCLDPIGLSGGETPYAYVHNPWDWVDLFGLLKEFGIAPYASILHKNDGFDAHELLQNSWLEQNGFVKQRGRGLSRRNPAIAIKNDPLHKAINNLQRKYGLYDQSKLKNQSALSNINKNAAITRRAITEDLVGRGIDRKTAKSLANKHVSELRKQTIDFAKANNIISCRG
ncbi:RHS repeat domain-containing protein, partial [Muribacter muris]